MSSDLVCACWKERHDVSECPDPIPVLEAVSRCSEYRDPGSSLYLYALEVRYYEARLKKDRERVLSNMRRLVISPHLVQRYFDLFWSIPYTGRRMRYRSDVASGLIMELFMMHDLEGVPLRNAIASVLHNERHRRWQRTTGGTRCLSHRSSQP